MRSEQEANRALDLYSDTVRRICMIHLKNYADTEDIFQTVFLKYVLSSKMRNTKKPGSSASQSTPAKIS